MSEPVEIRMEHAGDVKAIRGVHRDAFEQEQEGLVVDALRERGGVLLSLVASVNGGVVGHILFSPATIGPVHGAALEPMAVAQAHQRRGIGSQLVSRGLEILSAHGCPAVVVIGHPEFYPRFGFEPAVTCGLTCDWDVPPGAFMVKVLDPRVAGRLRGHVGYPTEFSTL